MDIRQKLLALSIYCEGNYDKMLTMIENKEVVDDLYTEKNKANFVTILDENYPKNFRHIHKPPILFYYYGNYSLLDNKKMLSVIGTRLPNSYQEHMTKKLVSEVLEKSENKVTIVSGMARGIDQIAMKEAMKRNAPVISIIASGIDNPYPKDNDDIYQYCKSNNGLIISEHPLDYEAKKEDFLFRNRLLAGICRSLLITGAKIKSGTSSTVRYALDFGKDILSVPCNISSDGDDLTNSLIQEGAKSILSSNDVLESLCSCF